MPWAQRRERAVRNAQAAQGARRAQWGGVRALTSEFTSGVPLFIVNWIGVDKPFTGTGAPLAVVNARRVTPEATVEVSLPPQV